MSHADIFNDIYRNKSWGVGSGHGSTEANTRPYREYLQHFLRLNRVSSVVDVGCGDWQFSQFVDWSGVSYTGIDVSSVVLENTKLFARAGVEFRQLDACQDTLPRADLLIAKDVLQHWPNRDICFLLPRLSAFRFALITNGFAASGDRRTNTDICVGMWRPVDLSKEPFNLPGAYVFEFIGDEPKQTFLWCNNSYAFSTRTDLAFS
jgi:SAM-dependent methyltransferase